MGKEIWKDVEEFTNYQVSNIGRVKNLHSSKILKLGSYKAGYLICRLGNKENNKLFLVHRLVARHFINNPENKRTLNHINGIKTDNSAVNLEWGTDKENVNHAIDLGLNKCYGENCNFSKLSENQVLQIRHLLSTKEITQNEIAEKFNVHQSTISDIKTRRNWNSKHLSINN